MDLPAQIREAVLNLFSAKLRSFLAILGVLVGAGSVVALISSSQLATSHALEQFKTLGTNLMAMFIQDDPSIPKTTQSPRLKLNDVKLLQNASPLIVQSAPYVTLYQGMSFKGQTFNGQVVGATDSFADIAKIDLERGRFVSILDKSNFFCVVGAKVAQQISAAGLDPLYQQIRVGSNYFTIVGIAKSWQPNFFLFIDMDSGIVIPIQTAFLMSSEAEIDNILFRLVEKPNLKVVQDQLTQTLQQIMPNKKADFRNPEQIIEIIAKQKSTFTWLLAAIGSISLIVGGIGVMNIMLVSVVERRREIGVRMAIGARRIDILKMFLIESVILTLFGGALGVLIGVGISYALATTFQWGFHLYILPPLLGFIVSVLVGIISGFYPALRAASLDPIQTLQAE
jgi:putative ABC transport system permease protein